MKIILGVIAAIVLFAQSGSSQIIYVSPSQIVSAGATVGQSLVWGTIHWSPGVAGVSCPVTAQAIVICVHNLNSTSVSSWVWDSAGLLVRPALKTNGTVNTTTITFDSPFTGIIVIK